MKFGKPSAPEKRGFTIADDVKPAAAAPPPAAMPDSAIATLNEGPRTLAAVDAEARSRGLVHFASVEVRLRCLEVLQHMQFRTIDAAAMIKEAAQLEHYVLHGGPTETPAANNGLPPGCRLVPDTD